MTSRIDISDEPEPDNFHPGRMFSELQTPVLSKDPDHILVLDLTQVKLVDRDAVRFAAQVEILPTQKLLRFDCRGGLARAE